MQKMLVYKFIFNTESSLRKLKFGRYWVIPFGILEASIKAALYLSIWNKQKTSLPNQYFVTTQQALRIIITLKTATQRANFIREMFKGILSSFKSPLEMQMRPLRTRKSLGLQGSCLLCLGTDPLPQGKQVSIHIGGLASSLLTLWLVYQILIL